MGSGPLLFVVSMLAFSLPARGQDEARLVAALGDPENGEAAEIALVALGEPAAPLMIEVLREVTEDRAARQRRQRAALRVLSLLGPDAAAVGSGLAASAVDETLAVDAQMVLAGLRPWDGSETGPPSLVEERAADCMAVQWRKLARQIESSRTTDALLAVLADNRMFEREAAADLLGYGGDVAAVGPLCEALRARREAVDASEANHNGFPIAIADGFRFAAGEAVLRLAPEDPRAAIAWSARSLLHPHRTLRLQALATLGRYVPAIDDCVPDLIAIAGGTDAELAAESIKVLGMAQGGGAECLGELERLAAGSGAVAAHARALVARQHAAGARAVAAPAPAAAAGDEQLRAAVAALAGKSDQEGLDRVVAAGAAALPFLCERLRIEHRDLPDAAMLAIGRIGAGRPERERATLREQVSHRHGDNWTCPGFGWRVFSSSDQPNRADYLALTELSIGDEAASGELAERLLDDDPYVRLVAAQRLVARIDTPRAADLADARAALIAAARAEHPKKAPKSTMPLVTDVAVDLDACIHAAAAAALVGCDLGADERAEFTKLLLAGDDAAAIARGLRRWADPRSIEDLGLALRDRRTPIAIAAAEAIGSLGAAGAAASGFLRQAAADERAEVAAAARRALQAVGDR